jgi:hypothetical protein
MGENDNEKPLISQGLTIQKQLSLGRFLERNFVVRETVVGRSR